MAKTGLPSLILTDVPVWHGEYARPHPLGLVHAVCRTGASHRIKQSVSVMIQ